MTPPVSSDLMKAKTPFKRLKKYSDCQIEELMKEARSNCGNSLVFLKERLLSDIEEGGFSELEFFAKGQKHCLWLDRVVSMLTKES